MQIKFPEELGVTIKGGRGFSYLDEVYAARPATFTAAVLEVFPTGVVLKPGEETPVSVSIDLPVNANVHKITARLEVVDDPSSSAAQQTTVSLKEGGDSRTYQVGVDAVTGIRNVEIKLGQGDVFWQHSGALKAGSYQLPDFARELNTYLDQVKANEGKLALEFRVKADTGGRVKISIDAGVDYSLIQTQSWKNDLDSTFRVDRNMQLDFSAVERLSLDPINKAGNQRVSRSSIKLDVGGKFGAERLLGEAAAHDGKQLATISPDYSLAQSIMLVERLVKQPVHLTGITLLLQGEEAAEIYVEVQDDVNGTPASGTPLAKCNLSFAPAKPEARQSWTFTRFEAPVELKVDRVYWVVVKGIRSIVRLALQPGPDSTNAPVLRGALMLNRGGQIWKSLSRASVSPILALLGLVYLPEIDNQTAGIQIAVEGTRAAQTLDPGPGAKTVSIDLTAESMDSATLVITSKAQGMLSIANVIQEYKLG